MGQQLGHDFGVPPPSPILEWHMQAVTEIPASTPVPAAQPAAAPLRLSRLSDELLARQAARGSRRAFATLYERYHQPLYQYCRSILRHDADAHDALQSTFTKALAALQRSQRNAPLRPWLYRIAHNEAISAIRLRQRERHCASPDGAEPVALAASAAEEAESRERWAMLMADLAELPERQRAALLLRELSGLPHEEIALALQTTAGGAKQSIFEARQTLAEFAEGREMSCQDICRRISDGDGRVLRSRRVRAHLRSCGGCSAFAQGIGGRRSELRGLAPVLPPAAAAALLSHVLHGAGSHAAGAAGAAAGSGAIAGSGAAVGSGAVAGAGVTGKLVTGALIWKAAAGVAVLATAAAGVATLRHDTAATDRTPAAHSHAVMHHRSANRGIASPSARQRGLVRAEAVTGKSLPVAKGLHRSGSAAKTVAADAVAVTGSPVHPGTPAAATRSHSPTGASRAQSHSTPAAGQSHSQASTHRSTGQHRATRRRPVDRHVAAARPAKPTVSRAATTPAKPVTK